jgi:2-alkenal reductase
LFFVLFKRSIHKMKKQMRTGLAVVAMVGLLALAIVLAVGNLTWSPAADLTASERAMAVDPLVLQEGLAQQDTDGEPSQDLLAELYDRVLPSVVNIQVTQGLIGDPNLGMPGMPAQGQGSGWLWDGEGHIVTNNHVVEGASGITVFFHNGLWAEAELVAADPQADLAVIRLVDAPEIELVPLPLAAEVPPVGYYTLAFGSPFGLAGTMTKGIISAVGRSFPLGDAMTPGSRYSLPDVIQTDAAINPGNSGGPLLNLNGEVIGVNFAIRSEVRANAGVGFAIPVSVIERVVPALIADGAYAYPYLGLGGSSVDPAITQREELAPGTLGVFVGSVEPNGPAAAAGLQVGDIITAIDGEEVRVFEDMISYLINQTQPGDTVELSVLRDGAQETLSVTLGERPREQADPLQQVTVGQAIDIAREAVIAAGVLTNVEASTARPDTVDGQQVWVVELEGTEGIATILVDAITGEVLTMSLNE